MLKSTARAIRSLLDGERVLTLAVIVDGVPHAGLLAFVAQSGYSGVLVHASRMSRHGVGLAAGGAVGILLHEQDSPGKDPLQLKRATFECRVHPLERKGSEWLEGRERYLGRFPDSRITFNLGDFTLYRLALRQGLYVGGFGRAVELPPRDVARLATFGLD